jgi:cell division inhibitor SulA/protein ImuA
LQLAAESGDSLGVLFRSPQRAREASPAALRMRLSPQREGGLNVEILKSRGSWPAAPLTLAMGLAR